MAKIKWTKDKWQTSIDETIHSLEIFIRQQEKALEDSRATLATLKRQVKSERSAPCSYELCPLND